MDKLVRHDDAGGSGSHTHQNDCHYGIDQVVHSLPHSVKEAADVAEVDHCQDGKELQGRSAVALERPPRRVLLASEVGEDRQRERKEPRKRKNSAMRPRRQETESGER